MDFPNISTLDDFKAFVAAYPGVPVVKETLRLHGIFKTQLGQLPRTATGSLPVVAGTYTTLNGTNKADGTASLWLQVFGVTLGRLQEEPDVLVFRLNRTLLQKAWALFAPYQDDLEHHANVDEIAGLLALSDEEIERYEYVFVFKLVPSIIEMAYAILTAASLGYLSYEDVEHLSLGAFAKVLPNLAWEGSYGWQPEYLVANRRKLIHEGKVPRIDFEDKFPRLFQHLIINPAVRIGDAACARLGTCLGDGVTVMPYAFVNAFTFVGNDSMVEGRVAAFVRVGEGADLGAASGIIGTSSGGGKERVALGKNILLGALAEAGVSLGEGVILAAGVHLMAPSKVFIPNEEIEAIRGANAALFDADSVRSALFQKEVPEEGKTLNRPLGVFLKGDDLRGLGDIVVYPATGALDANFIVRFRKKEYTTTDAALHANANSGV